MRAALYARKSTEQERGETGDSLSVEEQIAGAREFIASKGWTLGPVFKDEAVSGWKIPLEERPGGKALIAAARAHEFDVLVMRNETRLGREMADALTSLVMLTRIGIRVYYYATGQEVTLRTAKDKLVASIGHFGAEDYAERVSSDTRRGKLKRAQAGHWQGPRVFGYRKVETLGAKGERQHVDLVIDPAEADQVRQMFRWVSEGWGLRRVARQVGKGTTGIKYLMNNPLYQGILRYRGHKDDGTVEIVEITKPELAIVTDELWKQAHARLARSRTVHTGYRKPDGTLHGRPPAPSLHLFGGLLKCGDCGRSLMPIIRTKPSGLVLKWWGCSQHYKQRTCTNRKLIPYERLESAILAAFERLTPGIVEDLVAAEFERTMEEIRELSGRKVTLLDEQGRLAQELSRLAEAVAQGGELPALLSTMQRKQLRVSEINALLEHLDGIEPDVQNKLAAWQATMTTIAWRSVEGLASVLRSKDGGRQVLVTLFPQAITVSPEWDAEGQCQGWTFSGDAYLGSLLGRVPATVSKQSTGYTCAPFPWAARG